MQLAQTQIFKAVFLSLAAAALLVIVPSDAAFAIGAAGNTLGNTICAISAVATGNVGKGIATIAVVSVGIAACFGRASWIQALMVAIGIAVIGTAAALAGGLLGTTAC